MNKNCKNNTIIPDKFSVVVVQNIHERDNLSCKLRQNGTIAIVVEEGYAQYQIQTQEGLYSVCDNLAWIEIVAGEKGTSYGRNNLIILRNEKEKNNYLLGGNNIEGQMIYYVPDEKYYIYKSNTFKDPFPNKIDNIKLNESIEYKNVVTVKTDSDKKRLITTNNAFTETNMYNAVISGFDVFPQFDAKLEEHPTRMYNKNYVAVGVDIFKNFKGNTSYRPDHPAHDALIAFGNRLGGGVEDGTNFNLFGTGVLTLNDVKTWDSINAFGNNIENNKRVGDPNRVVNAISDGANLRGMMTGLNLFGTYIWAGDMQNSCIFGSSVKYYKYIYNSLVLGNDHQAAYTGIKYPGENLDVVLDHDVLIGHGLFKDPKRYPQTHNLLIGATSGYGENGFLNYKPLIEGNFKNKTLNINGDFTVTSQLLNNRVPVADFPLSLYASPDSLSTFNPSTGDLKLNGTKGGEYVLANNLTVGEIYILEIYPTSDFGGGTWGFNFGDRTDSENRNNYSARNIIFTAAHNTGKIILVPDGASGFTGSLKVTLKKVDKTSVQKEIFSINNYQDQPIFGIRVGDYGKGHLNIGENMHRYVAGSNNVIAGHDNAMSANLSDNSVVIGSKNLNKILNIRMSRIIGHNNLNNALDTRNTIAIGENIANETDYNYDNIMFGTNVFYHMKPIFNPNIFDAASIQNCYNVAMSSHAGYNVQNSYKSIYIGFVTGGGHTTVERNINIKNSIYIGPEARTNTVSGEVENEIVIGRGAVGNGNNTATIGDNSVKKVFLGGSGASIVLKSSNGTSFKISVDDSGNLTTTPL